MRNLMNNLCFLVLSILDVGPKDRTQAVRLDSKLLNPLKHLSRIASFPGGHQVFAMPCPSVLKAGEQNEHLFPQVRLSIQGKASLHVTTKCLDLASDFELTAANPGFLYSPT